jgi:hypothetical protein
MMTGYFSFLETVACAFLMVAGKSISTLLAIQIKTSHHSRPTVKTRRVVGLPLWLRRQNAVGGNRRGNGDRF